MEQVDRRSFLRLAGGGVAGGLAFGAAPGRVAPARAARRPDGPNVLVLMIDTLRPDYLGAYGNPWIRTPSIDALARQSLRFTRAFPEAMPTVPARRSLLLGRRLYPWHDWQPTRNLPGSPGWTGLDERAPTWLKTMRARGWWTTYVTDNPFLAFSPEWKGFRGTVDRFQRVAGQVGARVPASTIPEREVLRWLPQRLRDERYRRGMRQHLANTGGGKVEEEANAARVFMHAMTTLDEARRRRPFAMVVDCFDPHEPWTPAAKYRSMYGDPRYRGSEPANVRYAHADYLTEAERQRLPALYAAAVTMVDTWLGRFLNHFFDSGLADDTIVMLLSDHGIVLGERGWTGKPALELHPQLIQVPMLLRDPYGRKAGTTSAYFSSPHDVGPTMLAMAGLGKPETMDGTSLGPLLRGRSPSEARPFCYGGYANHWYYRDDRWSYIADGNNRGRELFALAKDPGEETTIAPNHPRVLDEIYRRVLRAAGVRALPYFGRDKDAQEEQERRDAEARRRR